MNEQSRTRTSREDEKFLHVKSKYKGICTNFGKYGHASKDWWHRKGADIPKFHYSDKVRHFNNECQIRIRE